VGWGLGEAFCFLMKRNFLGHSTSASLFATDGISGLKFLAAKWDCPPPTCPKASFCDSQACSEFLHKQGHGEKAECTSAFLPLGFDWAPSALDSVPVLADRMGGVWGAAPHLFILPAALCKAGRGPSGPAVI
jgi:hypothetical protein